MRGPSAYIVIMICPRCADAADRRLPAETHCSSTRTDNRCDCQHRTDRYRTEAQSDPLTSSGPLP